MIRRVVSTHGADDELPGRTDLVVQDGPGGASITDLRSGDSILSRNPADLDEMR